MIEILKFIGMIIINVFKRNDAHNNYIYGIYKLKNCSIAL